MKKLFCLVSAIAFISSCKKDHVPDPGQTQAATSYSIDDFTKFTPGNYWVYQNFQIDTNGNVMSVSTQLDSNYVSNDSTINGNSYHVIKGSLCNYPIIECVRDSGGYLVNSSGQRIFTATHFDSVFDTTGSVPGSFAVSTSVPSLAQGIIVGAGAFQCFDAKTEIYNLNPNCLSYQRHRTVNMEYASGTGLVLGTLFYSTPSYHFEDRLLRYHVQ